MSFSEISDVSYHLDNGSVLPSNNPQYDPTSNDYFDWLNRFEAQLAWENWHAGARFDSAVFFNAPQVVVAPNAANLCSANPNAPPCENLHLAGLLENRYTDNFGLEKISVDYSSEHLSATLGDFYLSYGRGLVLSLLKIDALGVDTTLRGASVTTRYGGFSANVAAGVTNTMNTDPATAEVAPDPMDRVLAGRLEYRWPRLLTAGIDAVGFFQNVETASLSTFTPGAATIQKSLGLLTLGQVMSQPLIQPRGLVDTGNVSATLDFPHLGNFAKAYVEMALQQNWVGPHPLSTRPTTGSAIFGSLAFFLGRTTVTLEGKDYQGFYYPVASSLSSRMFTAFYQQNVYTNPPNLEEQFQEESASLSIVGPRLRVDYDLNEWIKPFASFAFFEDDTAQYNIYAGSAGVEAFWKDRRSHAKITGGIRDVLYNRHFSQPGAPYQLEGWIQFDVLQVLTSVYSLQLEGLHRRYFFDALANHSWSWGYAYLALRRSAWSATVGYEYNTEYPQVWRSANPNAGFAWNPNDHYTLRLFAGGREAGLRCINGICRVFPGFTGASVELVARY